MKNYLLIVAGLVVAGFAIGAGLSWALAAADDFVIVSPEEVE